MATEWLSSFSDKLQVGISNNLRTSTLRLPGIGVKMALTLHANRGKSGLTFPSSSLANTMTFST
jgi:hypothetical protein